MTVKSQHKRSQEFKEKFEKHHISIFYKFELFFEGILLVVCSRKSREDKEKEKD